MPGCCVETKRRGIALGLIACSAVVMSAKVARAGGRVRALLRSSLAPCGGDLLSRGLEGGHSAQAHAAQAHASASRVATKKSIPTCSLIFHIRGWPGAIAPIHHHPREDSVQCFNASTRQIPHRQHDDLGAFTRTRHLWHRPACAGGNGWVD